MPVAAVLFDLDGTLVHTLPDICNNLNSLRVEWGLRSLPESELVRHIGRGVESLIRGGFPEVPSELTPKILGRYREIYLEQISRGGFVYPGVETVLRELRGRGLRLGIVTNKPTEVAEKTLAHYLPGILFDCVAGPERVSRQKPDAAHLLEPIGWLGLSPHEVYFVGDDPVDAACARASGVSFLAASYGFGGVTAPFPQQLQVFSEILEKIPALAV